MPKILVIGARGQLGQSFRYWASDFAHFDFDFQDLPEFDLSQVEQLQRYFKTTPTDVVINCAAHTAVDQAEDQAEKARRLNAVAVQSLCTLAKTFGFKLIHFSTDYVFDGTATRPYDESQPVGPTCVYGLTKAEGENAMLHAEIDGWIIRTAWLFSPYGKNFVKTIFSLLQNKEEIKVVADQTGSPTYAPDLAQAVLQAITQKPTFRGVEIYHFANAGQTTWYGLATQIKKQLSSSCVIRPVTTADYPTQANRPKFSVLNCDKIKKEFNFTPRSWQSALEVCLKKIK